MTRSDLPPGHQATQSVHAALTFAAKYALTTDYLVLLQVPHEAALTALAEHLPSAVQWREPDWNDSLTAIAVEGTAHNRKWLSSLPLLLKERPA